MKRLALFITYLSLSSSVLAEEQRGPVADAHREILTKNWGAPMGDLSPLQKGIAGDKSGGEWRAGIESLNRGLDHRTGIKPLGVRGMKAVKHSVYAKVMGWNIIQSARAI